MSSKTRKLKNRVRKSVKKNTRKSVKKNTRKTFKRKSLKKSTRNFLKKNTSKYLKIQKGGWNIDEVGKVVDAYLHSYNLSFLFFPSDILKIYEGLLPFLNKISYGPVLNNYLTSKTNEGEVVVNIERLKTIHLYMTVKIILEYTVFTSDTMMPIAMNLPMEEMDKYFVYDLVNRNTKGRVDVKDRYGNIIKKNLAPTEFNKAYLSLVSIINKSSEDADLAPKLQILKDKLVELFQKAKRHKDAIEDLKKSYPGKYSR